MSARPSPGGSPRTRSGSRPSRDRGDVLPAGDPALDLGPDEARTSGRRARRRTRRRRAPAGPVAGSWPGSSRRRCTGTGRRPRRAVGPRRLQQRDRLAGRGPRRPREPHLRCETWSRAPVPGRHGWSRSPRRAPRTARRLVAHVGRVQAAVPCRGAATSASTSATARVHARGVDEPGRQADRAGVHGRVDLADHRGELVVRRRPRLGPEDRPAHRPVPDEERDVRRRAAARSTRSRYSSERVPARGQPVRAQRQLDQLAAGRRDRRERVAAVARELGREPLAEVAARPASTNNGAVRVAVRIDEPGRHDPSGARRSPARPRPDRPIRGRRPRGSGRRGRRRRPAGRGPPVPSMTVPPRSSRSKLVTAMMMPPGTTRPGRLGARRSPAPGRPRPSATLRLPWGYSSAGRAPAWHAGGPGFESP